MLDEDTDVISEVLTLLRAKKYMNIQMPLVPVVCFVLTCGPWTNQPGIPDNQHTVFMCFSAFQQCPALRWRKLCTCVKRVSGAVLKPTLRSCPLLTHHLAYNLRPNLTISA